MDQPATLGIMSALLRRAAYVPLILLGACTVLPPPGPGDAEAPPPSPSDTVRLPPPDPSARGEAGEGFRGAAPEEKLQIGAVLP